MEGLFMREQQQQMATNKELIIRQGSIFFQDEIQFRFSLTLKLTIGKEIHKFRDFQWNPACRRWEQKHIVCIPWPNQDQIMLEIYTQEQQSAQNVLGEGIIRMHTVQAYLSREIRISLTYDGAYVGCLYCVVSDQVQENQELSKHFLYMHKMQIHFVESVPHTFKLKIFKNDLEVYEKNFHLHSRAKILFPNIKVPVKMSDVLIVDITHKQVTVKPIKFVIDGIKRGKTSVYEVWLRNIMQNKAGELRIEYFLDNFYLDNQRQIFSRRAILASKTLNPSIQIEPEKEKVKRSVLIKQLEEAAWRIKKIDVSVHKVINNLQDKSRNSLYQTAPVLEAVSDISKTSLQRISRKIAKSKKTIRFQEI